MLHQPLPTYGRHSFRFEEFSEDSEVDSADVALPERRSHFIHPHHNFGPCEHTPASPPTLPGYASPATARSFSYQEPPSPTWVLDGWRDNEPQMPTEKCVWAYSSVPRQSLRSDSASPEPLQAKPTWPVKEKETDLDLGTALDGERLMTTEISEKGAAHVVSQRVKAKRIKALEKAFGSPDPARTPMEMREKARRAEVDRRVREVEHVGEVNGRGELITVGRKKRKALRWAQGLLALAAAIGTIGISVALHPSEDPPPRGTLPLYLFYGLSPISLLTTLWIFVLSRCRGQRNKAPNEPHGPLLLQQQVCPPLAPATSSSFCCCGRSKSKKRSQPQQPVHVNLMLDPSWLAQLQAPSQPMFEASAPQPHERSRRRRVEGSAREDEKYENDEDHDDDDSIASEFRIPSDDDVSAGQQGGLLERLAAHRSARVLAQQVQQARKKLKVRLCVDVLLSLLWATVTIWAIGFGEKCSPGTCSGWCDGYNAALAAGAFLSLVFAASAFLGFKDLSQSK